MKYIKILIILFLVVSCSSSDDTPEVSNDEFVGKWFFGNVVYKLESGNDFVESVSSCEVQSFYRFNSNSSAELVSFIENGSNCEQEPNNISSFTWEKVSSGLYKLNAVESDGTENSNTETVVFESENTMYWIDTFGNGFTINGEPYSERWTYFNK